jgi:predicted O-methyltransferase YrrM
MCDDKVGVDPVSGGTIRCTSDVFFATNPQLFDVIFIDGLHTYDQVRRDVMNSLCHLKNGGYIAIHDLLPTSWLEHHVPRLNDVWTGDIWKVAFEILESNGIDFKIVKIDHGIGVLRVNEETAGLADLTNELRNKQFEYFYRNLCRLPVVGWKEFLIWSG